MGASLLTVTSSSSLASRANVAGSQVRLPPSNTSIARSYYCHFGKYILNRDYVMLPFGELDRCNKTSCFELLVEKIASSFVPIRR